jgi:hypothetical protein
LPFGFAGDDDSGKDVAVLIGLTTNKKGADEIHPLLLFRSTAAEAQPFHPAPSQRRLS